MGKRKEGRQIVIDHMVLFGILGDQELYLKVPALQDLRGEGLARHQEVLDEALQGADCTGCQGLAHILRPIAQKFVKRIDMLKKTDPEAIASFVDYIADKCGYRPRPIVMYHRELLGRPTRLEL